MRAGNQQGSSVIIAVVLISVMGFAFLMAYQGVLRVYQQRYAKLKQAENLHVIAEALAVSIRQARDVALNPPEVIAGVPQCPPPIGAVLNYPAEGHCFREGGCAFNQRKFFCFPPGQDDSSRCVKDDRGVRYCWGQDSTSGTPGHHSDIRPLRVVRRENPHHPHFAEVAEMRKLFESHWTDSLRPVSETLVALLDRSQFTRPHLGSMAVAQTTNPFTGDAEMDTTACAGTNTQCKRCESGVAPGARDFCVEIALCPSFLSEATCQAQPVSRYFQVVLLTGEPEP